MGSSPSGPIMKICAMSDLHRHQIDIPKCNVLAIAGDIGGCDDSKWFNTMFVPYLDKHKNKFDICILVLGNHDDEIQFSNDLEIPSYVKLLTNNDQ